MKVHAMKHLLSSAAVAGGFLVGQAVLADDAREVAKAPMAKKITRVETVHGEKLVDEYFWMRDKKNRRSRRTSTRKTPTPTP